MSDVIIDGREARADKNRTACIEAGLRLIEHGNWRATAVEIADEAGISRRTFFNHFTNVEYFRCVLLAGYKPQLLNEVIQQLNTPELILTEVMR